jgi:hypothetical protein
MTETPRFFENVIATRKIGYRDDACGAREHGRKGSALLKIQPADFSEFFSAFFVRSFRLLSRFVFFLEF